MLKELVTTGLKKENSRDANAVFDKILNQSSSANKLSSKERERQERMSMMDISQEADVEARLKSEKKKALLNKIEQKTTPKSKEGQKTPKEHKPLIDTSKKASITSGSKKPDSNKKHVSVDPKRSQNLDLKIKKKPSTEPDRTTRVFDTLYKDDTKVKISKITDVPISRNSAASKSVLNPFEDIIRQKELQMKSNKTKGSVESKTGSSSQNDRKHIPQKSDKVVKKDVMTVSEKIKFSKQENSKPRQDDTKSGKDSVKKTPKFSDDLDIDELKKSLEKKVRQEYERKYKEELEKLKAQENPAKPKEISNVSKDKDTKISKNGDPRQETKAYNPLDTSRPKDQKQPSKPVDEIKHKSSSEKDTNSKSKAYDPLQSRPPLNINGVSKAKDSSDYPQIKKKHEDKDARPRDSEKQHRETELRDKDKGRERDREREKERYRERDRDRERNRDRDTDIDRDREKDLQREREKNKEKEREKDKEREREKERERRERERKERERKERERKEREKEVKNVSKHRDSEMEEEEEDEGDEEDSIEQEEDESESFDSDASGPRRYADYRDDLDDINKESLKSIDDNEISAEIAALEAKLKRQRNMQEKEKPRKGI